jgi:enoyl-CoA hydratase/carnithine racemase
MSAAATRWNRVSRRPLADILDELHTARTLAFEERCPGVVVMSVNRPDRANSQTVEMFGEIAWVAATLRNAPLRALIVTGAGGKAFCTGFDLDEIETIAKMSIPEFTDLVESAAAGSTGLRALPYPVIAAVSGPAAGGGFSLALPADLPVADATASFSVAFVRVLKPSRTIQKTASAPPRTHWSAMWKTPRFGRHSRSTRAARPCPCNYRRLATRW